MGWWISECCIYLVALCSIFATSTATSSADAHANVASARNCTATYVHITVRLSLSVELPLSSYRVDSTSTVQTEEVITGLDVLIFYEVRLQDRAKYIVDAVTHFPYRNGGEGMGESGACNRSKVWYRVIVLVTTCVWLNVNMSTYICYVCHRETICGQQHCIQTARKAARERRVSELRSTICVMELVFWCFCKFCMPLCCAHVRQVSTPLPVRPVAATHVWRHIFK